VNYSKKKKDQLQALQNKQIFLSQFDIPPEHCYLEHLRGLNIQIASDLHIEFFNDNFPIPKDIIVPVSPVLALLGDIGLPFNDSFEKFLLDQTTSFELVLFLPGNHEYYQHEELTKRKAPYTLFQIEEKMKEICAKSPKLIYLNHHCIKIGGVRVIGATLWSYVPSYAYVSVASSLNDYNFIFFNGSETITPNHTNDWHNQHLSYIFTQVENSIKNGEENCLVLTHHAPSMTGVSGPRYEGILSNKTNHAFSTPLDYLFRNYGRVNNSNIHSWGFGHTHFSCNIERNGTFIVSNQRGYRTSKTINYNPSFSIHIPKLQD